MAPVAAPPRCAAYPTCTRPGVGSRPYQHGDSTQSAADSMHSCIALMQSQRRVIELYEHLSAQSFVLKVTCRLPSALLLMQHLQTSSKESCKKGLP